MSEKEPGERKPLVREILRDVRTKVAHVNQSELATELRVSTGIPFTTTIIGGFEKGSVGQPADMTLGEFSIEYLSALSRAASKKGAKEQVLGIISDLILAQISSQDSQL